MTKWIIRESVIEPKYSIYWSQESDEPSPELAVDDGWDSSEAAIADLKDWLSEPGTEMAIWDVLPVQIEVGESVFTIQTPEEDE